MPKKGINYYLPTLDMATIINNGWGTGFTAPGANDYGGNAVGGGNIFNMSSPGFFMAAYNAGPGTSAASGKGYVAAGPLIASTGPTGIIPAASVATYYKYAFTFTGADSEQACTSVDVADLDGDNIPDILCGNSGIYTYGGGYWMKGGTAFQSVGSLGSASFNGNNGCRFTSFFTSGDGCGTAARIVKNVTGNGNNGLVFTCPTAFSGLGAVIVIPYTPNFCSGGTFTLANLDGTHGTYYKGVIANGQLGGGQSGAAQPGGSLVAADLNLDGAQDLTVGSLNAGTYFIPGGPSIMGVPPLSVVNLGVATGQSGDKSGNVVVKLGDIYNNGLSNVMISAYAASQWGLTNAGRGDILRASSNFTANITLPTGLNGNNGFSIYDTTAGDTFSQGGNAIGDINADNITDSAFSAPNASPFGRTNAGKVAICFGGSTAFQGNSTIIYQNLIDGINCVELEGGAAGDSTGIGYSVSGIGDWNLDGVNDIAVCAPGNNGGTGLCRIVYWDVSPIINYNNFTISDGQRVIFNSSYVNATDLNHPKSTFNYTVASITNGYFALGSSTIPISNFTAAQFASNQVQFQHFGNHLPPTYSIGVNTTGFAYLPPQSASVNFLRTIPAAFARNNITIPQGGTVGLNQTNSWNVTDVYPAQNPSNLGISLSAVQHVQFNSTATNSALPNPFKQSLLINQGNAIVTQDGTRNVPSALVSAIDDTGLASTPQPVGFNFIPAPLLVNNTVSAIGFFPEQLSNTNIAALDPLSPSPANIIYTPVNLQNCFFARAGALGTAIPNFTHQDILNGVIYIVSENNNAPIYTLYVSNSITTAIDKNTISPQVNFHQRPVIAATQQPVVINVPRVLTTQDLNITNLLADPSAYTFYFSAENNITFSSVQNPSSAVTNATLSEIEDGLILVEATGLNPSYNVSATDNLGVPSTEVSASAKLLYRPQLVNNTLNINQNDAVQLSSTNIDALDLSVNPSTLLVTPFDVQNGYFARANNLSSAINNFYLAEVRNGTIYFVSNSAQKPAYGLELLDVANNVESDLSLEPVNATVTFRDIPKLVSNTASLIQDQCIPLTHSELSSSQQYNTSDISNHNFLIVNATGVSFRSIPQGIYVSQFQGKNITANDILHCADNTRNKGNYSVAVSDGVLTSVPQAANISKHYAPELGNVRLAIGEAQTVTLNPNDYNVTSFNNGDNLSTYQYFITGIQDLEFSSSNFSRIDLATGLAQVTDITPSNSTTIPGYNVTVMDNLGLTDGPKPATVDYFRVTANSVPGFVGADPDGIPVCYPITPSNLATNSFSNSNAANVKYHFGSNGVGQNVMVTSNSSLSQPVSSTITNADIELESYCFVSTANAKPSLTFTATEPLSGAVIGPFQVNFDNFVFKPTIVNNDFSSSGNAPTQGQSKVITQSMLYATDTQNTPPTPDAAININLLAVTHATISTNYGGGVTALTLPTLIQALNITSQEIIITPDQSAETPTLLIQICGKTCTDPFFVNMKLIVTNPPPSLFLSSVAVTRGDDSSLAGTALVTLNDASGNPVPQSTLNNVIISWPNGVQNGFMYDITNPNNSVTPVQAISPPQCTYGQYSSGSIHLKSNNKTAPIVSLQALNPANTAITSGLKPLPINFNNPPITPTIALQALSIPRNQQAPLQLSGSSPNDNAYTLTWRIISASPGISFANNKTGIPIPITDFTTATFTSADMLSNNILITAPNNNQQSSFTVMLTNSDGFSTLPTTININPPPVIYPPTLGTTCVAPQFPQAQSRVVTPADITATDDPGNIPYSTATIDMTYSARFPKASLCQIQGPYLNTTLNADGTTTVTGMNGQNIIAGQYQYVLTGNECNYNLTAYNSYGVSSSTMQVKGLVTAPEVITDDSSDTSLADNPYVKFGLSALGVCLFVANTVRWWHQVKKQDEMMVAKRSGIFKLAFETVAQRVTFSKKGMMCLPCANDNKKLGKTTSAFSSLFMELSALGVVIEDERIRDTTRRTILADKIADVFKKLPVITKQNSCQRFCTCIQCRREIHADDFSDANSFGTEKEESCLYSKLAAFFNGLGCGRVQLTAAQIAEYEKLDPARKAADNQSSIMQVLEVSSIAANDNIADSGRSIGRSRASQFEKREDKKAARIARDIAVLLDDWFFGKGDIELQQNAVGAQVALAVAEMLGADEELTSEIGKLWDAPAQHPAVPADVSSQGREALLIDPTRSNDSIRSNAPISSKVEIDTKIQGDQHDRKTSSNIVGTIDGTEARIKKLNARLAKILSNAKPVANAKAPSNAAGMVGAASAAAISQKRPIAYSAEGVAAASASVAASAMVVVAAPAAVASASLVANSVSVDVTADTSAIPIAATSEFAPPIIVSSPSASAQPLVGASGEHNVSDVVIEMQSTNAGSASAGPTDDVFPPPPPPPQMN